MRRDRFAEFRPGSAVAGPRALDSPGGNVPGDRGQDDRIPPCPVLAQIRDQLGEHPRDRSRLPAIGPGRGHSLGPARGNVHVCHEQDDSSPLSLLHSRMKCWVFSPARGEPDVTSRDSGHIPATPAIKIVFPAIQCDRVLWLVSGSQQSSVILVGSVSAFIGHENAAVYGAAKAGLLSFSRGLTYELKDRGIRVNGLSPGPTLTDTFKPLGPESHAAIYDELRRVVPLHRIGTATEVAKAAVYLASDESAYTVGTVLRVDGGIGELAY